ncbi:unnamed protein product [Strongylus vulgaris]|uniref:G-protein coupled receptors family 1 profile domain-containing protein n=1 Tax=Strongylus vulgaris TaxID=40348 RepID=A0A3P7LZ71_STRVU|nr:unnamed protein product [Strongylus vulgaris]
MTSRFCITLHCYTHSLYSLLFSFVYRYYILFHPSPRTRSIVIAIIAIYVPSFMQLMMSWFARSPEDELRKKLSQTSSYDIRREIVSGVVDIFDWKTLFVLLHHCVPVTPIYVVILLLRRRITAKLQTNITMSEKTCRMHSQLLKAITYQACLPLFFLYSLMAYLFLQFGISNHPLLEYTIYIVMNFIPSINPLISLYFVTPYRVWLTKRLLRRTRVASIITITQEQITNELERH